MTAFKPSPDLSGPVPLIKQPQLNTTFTVSPLSSAIWQNGSRRTRQQRRMGDRNGTGGDGDTVKQRDKEVLEGGAEASGSEGTCDELLPGR